MASDQDVGRPEPTREDAAYEAVMCWEWEGGALAPAAVDQPRGPQAHDARRRGRGLDPSHGRPSPESPGDVR
jgi:hypothetical protein